MTGRLTRSRINILILLLTGLMVLGCSSGFSANKYKEMTEKGDEAFASSEYQTALGYYQQALTLAVESENQENKATALYNIGHVYLEQGLAELALENLEKALNIRIELGDTEEKSKDELISLAEEWMNVAILQQLINDNPAALHSYQEALSIYETVGDVESIRIVEAQIDTLPEFEFNVNLVQNPGNEEPLVNGEIPYWEEVSGINWGRNAEVPVYEGNAYFDAGEAGEYAELRQIIDVSGYTMSIDDGQQKFVIEVHMRSYPLQLFVPVDGAQLSIGFYDADNEPLDYVISEQYFVTDRWAEYINTLLAPRGTRKISIHLVSHKYGGYDSDGYFDGLSLVALPPE